MGISLKKWMGQRGLSKESAMSLLGMASATFYRHFNGEVGSTMDEKLIQIDGLVTQLAAYSADGRQALNRMAEKRRRELLVPLDEGDPKENFRLVTVVNGRKAEPNNGVEIDLPALVRLVDALGDASGGFYESLIKNLLKHAIKHQSLSDAGKITVDVRPQLMEVMLHYLPHLPSSGRAFLDILTMGSELTQDVTLRGNRGNGSWPAQARLATAIMEHIFSKSAGEKVLFSVETESGMSVSHRPLVVS